MLIKETGGQAEEDRSRNVFYGWFGLSSARIVHET